MQSHLVYHYLTFKYQKKWNRFINSVHSFLPQSKGGKLLILGGSSGSCLKYEFLNQWEKIIIYDKDPLAPLFFKLRHGLKLPVKFYLEDAFSFDGKDLSAKRVNQIIREHDPDFILLSNVVGQLPIYYKNYFLKKNYIQWSEELVETLNLKKWLSFHDVFSFESSHSDKFPESFKIEKSDTINSILEKYRFPNVVHDHLTLEQKWKRPSFCIQWNLNPKVIHYVEVSGPDVS